MKTHLQLLITASCLGALSLTSAGHAQTPSPTAGSKMKAIVYHNYGPPEVLQLEEIEKPVPNDNQVLVKIRAVSVNPFDWHFMEGVPYIARLLAFGPMKPKSPRLGVDFAGTVEAVGKNITQFKPGDEVFGGKGRGLGRVCGYRREIPGDEAGQHHVRAGGVCPDCRAYRVAGSSRQGKDSARPESLDQRRVGRRGHVRRANRQAPRARM